MRSDLDQACASCGIRTPRLARCPCCDGELGDVAQAVDEPGPWVSRFGRVRPVRDVLLYVPALAVYALVTAWAVLVTGATSPMESGGATVIFAVVSLAACFAGGMMLAAVPWLLWAALVWFAWWLLPSPAPASLMPAHVSAGSAPMVARARAAWAHRTRRWKLALGLAIGALLLVELVAEALGPEPVFLRPVPQMLERIGVAMLAQLLAGLLLAIPISFAFAFAQHSVERLALVVLSRRRAAVSDARAAIARLEAGRSSARGRVMSGSLLEAPLSGRPCVAFRLTGSIGVVTIDDGEAVPFTIRGDAEVAVRSETWAVALPLPPIRRALDAEALARVTGFLRARSIETPLYECELGEAILEEGDEVLVHGAENGEAAAGDGYRSAGSRRVLDDSDGSPVLVQRP